MFPIECNLLVPVSSLMKGDKLAQSKFLGVIDLKPNFFSAFSLLTLFKFLSELDFLTFKSVWRLY
jgi:hypothetical protein